MKLHAYNAATTGFATTFDSRTGDTYTEKSDSQAERTNDNTIEGESNGLHTETDSDGNIDITTMDHEPYTEIVDDNWNGPQEQPFLLPNPAAAGLMPGNFFGQGLFPFGNSLFGTGFGNSSGRAPRTNLPPIATGTEPDGTYWELYDNGTIWIHRIYEKEGGRRIQETWGRHTQSMPDLLAEYQRFLKDRKKLTDNDKAFMDPMGLMNDLNKEETTPEEKAAADKLAETLKNAFEILQLERIIKGLHEQVNDPETSPGAKRSILLRLGKLIKRFEELGGDVAGLELSNSGVTENQSEFVKLQKKDIFDRILEKLITGRKYTTLADRSNGSNGSNDLLKDLISLHPHFLAGIGDGLASDLIAIAELGGSAHIGGGAFVITANPALVQKIVGLLAYIYEIPKTYEDEIYRVKKYGALGAAYIKEALTGSQSKADLLYDYLKKMIQEDYDLIESEYDALVELLKVAAEDISNLDLTPEEKARLLGRVFYEVGTLLIPGSAVVKGGVKATKGAKLLQVISKLAKSEKIAKLLEKLPSNSKIRQLFKDISQYRLHVNPHTTVGSMGGNIEFVRRNVAVGLTHPQTGHTILAEIEIGDKIDYIVESSKPSRKGKLVKKQFYENPGAHDPNGGIERYDSRKSILPENHVELFQKSIEFRGVRYAIDDNGAIHQFQNSINGVFHWAGSENGMTIHNTPVPLHAPPQVIRILRGNR